MSMKKTVLYCMNEMDRSVGFGFSYISSSMRAYRVVAHPVHVVAGFTQGKQVLHPEKLKYLQFYFIAQARQAPIDYSLCGQDGTANRPNESSFQVQANIFQI